jgi:A/G-specific adenine glycosylase
VPGRKTGASRRAGPGAKPHAREIARAPEIAREVEAWFARGHRDLPWRGPIGARRDPYAVLVSEVMLQQTQVSRVREKFPEFLARFPTIAALADADEAAVLAAWTGLGYYRRARLLHRAAREIVARFQGRVPGEVEELRSLPGLGRYTAGAVASIAFGQPAPIVDGNVARVLARLTLDGRAPAQAEDDHWARAQALVQGARSPGVFNEGLMELGATVCLPAPASPRCDACPLAAWCAARLENRAEEIPPPKPGAKVRRMWCASVRVRDARGRVLIEQRPGEGLWAGLWQAPTVESMKPLTRAGAARALGLAASALREAERFEFRATHRRMEFIVFDATEAGASALADREGAGGKSAGREWAGRAELRARGLSVPQRRILLAEGV